MHANWSWWRNPQAEECAHSEAGFVDPDIEEMATELEMLGRHLERKRAEIAEQGQAGALRVETFQTWVSCLCRYNQVRDQLELLRRLRQIHQACMSSTAEEESDQETWVESISVPAPTLPLSLDVSGSAGLQASSGGALEARSS